MKTQSLGKLIMIEYYGCSFEKISNSDFVRDALIESAVRANATIVTDVFHTFNPYGISGVVVIAESHVAIHTWPEHGCASVDIFSCSTQMTPEVIEDYLKQAFEASHFVKTEVQRGQIPCSQGVKI